MFPLFYAAGTGGAAVLRRQGTAAIYIGRQDVRYLFLSHDTCEIRPLFNTIASDVTNRFAKPVYLFQCLYCAEQIGKVIRISQVSASLYPIETLFDQGAFIS